jgi:cellulose synthase/poly-beta-1,6-N-acetylglucosamine synthase-like glycosyltransferase
VRPTITVVVTNYNHGEYLRCAVDSVLAQTRSAERVIVVDDGSTDSSQVVLDALPTSVEVVRQENRGIVSVRNRALSMVDTSHVLFLDADDHLLPGSLRWTEAGWRLPQRRLALVYTAARVLQVDGARGYLASGTWDRAALGRRNFVTNTALFSTTALADVGGYTDSFAEIGYEDWDLMLALAETGWTGRFIPIPLFTYRRLPTGRNTMSLGNRHEVDATIRAAHPWVDIGSTADRSRQSFHSLAWKVARRWDSYRWPCGSD